MCKVEGNTVVCTEKRSSLTPADKKEKYCLKKLNGEMVCV